MEDTLTRTRCDSCGKGLRFAEWSQNGGRCDGCSRVPRMQGPAATYVRGPSAATQTRQAVAADAAAYERLLDELPDELVDELVAALEAEAARLDRHPAPAQGSFQEVMQDIGIGRTPREMQWAAWGFAAGFAANVVLAKYAQMQSGAPMGQFVGPLLIGGVVAGMTAGAIAWGLARLRDH